MSRKHTTAATIKTTGRAVHTTAKGTAVAARFTVEHWRGLLPFLCVAAAGVYAVAAELFAWAYGPRAWLWTALIGLVLFVWADGWAGSLPRKIRPQGIAFVLFTIMTTVAFIVAAQQAETHLAIFVAALVLGTWWWNGSAYQGHKATERARRKMEGVLHKLGLGDGTKVTAVSTNDRGDVEWRLYLGDHDRIDQLKAEDIAHMLRTDTSRVIVRRTDKSSTRHVKVVMLAAALRKTKAVDHPAAAASGRAEGTDWAPGVRTVAEGAPIGPMMADPDRTSVFHVFRVAYGALHNLIAGMTGSGKSVTVSSVIAHAVASDDAVVAGVDLVKGGETFMPWHEAGAMANLLYLDAAEATDEAAFLRAAAELLDELTWLRAEVNVRTALMASGQVRDADGERTRVWPASRKTPVIVWIFEEYASTISAIEKLDAALADDIAESVNDLVRTSRSSGISVNIVTQRPVFDELPMTLRAQLNQTILHKLNTPNDLGKLWSEHDVDPISALAGGMGLCLVGGADDPALTKAYDLSKPRVCTEIARAYADAQPAIAWKGAQAVQGAPVADEQASAEPDAEGAVLALLRDAADDDTIPAGLGIIGGAADPEPGDDVRLAAILAALQGAAADGLTRAQVEAALPKGDAASTSTARRLLRVLQDDAKVIRTGQGKATRYRINTAALAAA